MGKHGQQERDGVASEGEAAQKRSKMFLEFFFCHTAASSPGWIAAGKPRKRLRLDTFWQKTIKQICHLAVIRPNALCGVKISEVSHHSVKANAPQRVRFKVDFHHFARVARAREVRYKVGKAALACPEKWPILFFKYAQRSMHLDNPCVCLLLPLRDSYLQVGGAMCSRLKSSTASWT